MKTINLVKRCISPKGWILAVVAVLAASAAARLRGEFEILIAVLSVLFAIALQIGLNFGMYYYDIHNGYGTWIDNKLFDHRNPKESVMQIFRQGGVAMLILSLTIGLCLMLMEGWWLVGPGLILYGFAYISISGPRPLMRTWAAPLVPFLFYGIGGAFLGGLVQIYYDNPDPFHTYYIGSCLYIGLGYGCLASNIQLTYGRLTYDDDRANCRGNFTSVFGKKAGVVVYFCNGVLMLVVMSVFVFTQYVRLPWVAIIPSIVSFVYNCYITARMDVKEVDPAVLDKVYKHSVYNIVVFSVLMFIMSFIIGDPDRSRLIYTTEVSDLF